MGKWVMCVLFCGFLGLGLLPECGQAGDRDVRFLELVPIAALPQTVVIDGRDLLLVDEFGRIRSLQGRRFLIDNRGRLRVLDDRRRGRRRGRLRLCNRLRR